MKPTEILMQEHEHIREMLKILENVCEKLEKNEKVPSENLNLIIDFIKGFADGCHHYKEENILFEKLVEIGFPKESGPIGVMYYEHDIGRNYVADMSAAISEIDNQSEKTKFIKNARNYSILLRDHINKEDNILYPMANARLSDEEQEEIKHAFHTVECKHVGHGKHEAYLNNLMELKRLYLKQE